MNDTFQERLKRLQQYADDFDQKIIQELSDVTIQGGSVAQINFVLSLTQYSRKALSEIQAFRGKNMDLNTAPNLISPPEEVF